jgi:hypothetical protein
MGFLSGILGTKNEYNPQDPDQVNNAKKLAPQSGFVAAPAKLNTQNYGRDIRETLDNAHQSYGQQQNFIDTLRARSEGRGGPSVAESMLQRSTDAATRGAASMVASQRGLAPGLAAKIGSDAAVGAQQESAGQLATLRAQEQLANTSLLGQALSTQGSQNLGRLGTVTGAEQGQNALALQNALGTGALNQGTAGQNAQLQLGQEQLAAGVGAGNAQANSQIVGGLLNGAGAAVASDERVKTDVHRLKSEAMPGVKEALFRYRGGNGSIHRGVIAQDVEQEYPELVGQTKAGVKTVPASLMKYAGGGEVAKRYAGGGDVGDYLDDLHNIGIVTPGTGGEPGMGTTPLDMPDASRSLRRTRSDKEAMGHAFDGLGKGHVRGMSR